MRWLLLLVLSLGGCAFPEADGTRSALYVGIVRVRMADRAGDLRAVDVKALGLGWDSAAFLGWRSGQWVSADPASCQLLVIVRSGVEAEQAARVFESLRGQRPCIADFSKHPLSARSP